jgi:hypothetical protein
VRPGFYEDVRYCSACGTYVRYLLSLDLAYCVNCGGRAALFSHGDRAAVFAGSARSPRSGEEDALPCREPSLEPA